MISLLKLIVTVIDLYIWCLVISIIMSWLIHFQVLNTSNRFVYMIYDMLYRLTDPVLRRIRSIMPNLGGLDISPVILILLLYFGQNLLIEYWPR